MTNPADSASPETLDELTGSEDGLWDVVTRSSVHRFDFAAGTVTRIPGPTAHPGINDVPRPLMKIHACRVGKSGYWTMHPDDWEIEHYWQHTTTIVRIERASEPASPLLVEPDPENVH